MNGPDASTIIRETIREAVRELLAEDPDALRARVMLRTMQGQDMVPDAVALKVAAEDFGISPEAVDEARARLDGRSGKAITFVDLDHGTIDVWEQPIPT